MLGSLSGGSTKPGPLDPDLYSYILSVAAASCRDEAGWTLVVVEAGPTLTAFFAAATMATKAGQQPLAATARKPLPQCRKGERYRIISLPPVFG